MLPDRAYAEKRILEVRNSLGCLDKLYSLERISKLDTRNCSAPVPKAASTPETYSETRCRVMSACADALAWFLAKGGSNISSALVLKYVNSLNIRETLPDDDDLPKIARGMFKSSFPNAPNVDKLAPQIEKNAKVLVNAIKAYGDMDYVLLDSLTDYKKIESAYQKQLLTFSKAEADIEEFIDASKDMAVKNQLLKLNTLCINVYDGTVSAFQDFVKAVMSEYVQTTKGSAPQVDAVIRATGRMYDKDDMSLTTRRDHVAHNQYHVNAKDITFIKTPDNHKVVRYTPTKYLNIIKDATYYSLAMSLTLMLVMSWCVYQRLSRIHLLPLD